MYGGSFVGNDGKTYYRDIDTGFLISKTCKHAFKTYPKLKVGLGALLQADIDTQALQKPSQEAFGAEEVAPEDKGVKVKVDSDSPF